MNLRRTRVPEKTAEERTAGVINVTYGSDVLSTMLMPICNINMEHNYHHTSGTFQISTGTYDLVFRGRNLKQCKFWFDYLNKNILINESDILYREVQDGYHTIGFKTK
jgi:hypothetical protein